MSGKKYVELAEGDLEKWKSYQLLTVDEAMSLICGFKPETCKFCGVPESDMPSESIPIYRALVCDFKDFKITMHISGTKVDWDSVCQLVHPDEFYNPFSLWWSTALLHVSDIKDWLRKNRFKSVFFDSDVTNVPTYLDNTLADCFSPKLAAAVLVWEHFFRNDQEKFLPSASLKEQMIKWLTAKSAELGLLYDGKPNTQGIEEIAKIANWKTKGGAPKQ